MVCSTNAYSAFHIMSFIFAANLHEMVILIMQIYKIRFRKFT